jgi:putative transposase
VSLRLLYLIFLRLLNLLLLGRSSASKDVELLVLRHGVCRAAPSQSDTAPGLGGSRGFAALVRRLPQMLCRHRVVAPGAILRWHRRLIVTKWIYPTRAGRPPLDDAVAVLIERMARENQSWGYQKNPRRVAQGWSSRGSVHDPPRSPTVADTSGTGPGHRHDLAAVPAHPGADDVGL